MKRLLIAISCMFFVGCDQESGDHSNNLVDKSDLELRVIDFVLIDPATGLPPVGPGYEIHPPQGDYPGMGKFFDPDADPFRFYYSWIAEKNEKPNILVRVDGYEDIKIGIDQIKRVDSHLHNTRVPLQKITLTPRKGEQDGGGKGE